MLAACVASGLSARAAASAAQGPSQTPADPRLAAISRYHEASKHRFEAFAPGPGGLDWATQPDPFRRFSDCQRFHLPLEGLPQLPLYDVLATPEAVVPQAIDARSVSALLLNSLALSATKRAGRAEWHLRVNPSSGNLHPTEAYLVVPALGAGLNDMPAVLHYCSEWHTLEQRATLADAGLHAELVGAGNMLIVLTSIYWREAWKYGMRAFRYCNHDVGHAVAAVRIAAAALGWQAQVLHGVADGELEALCGLDRPEFSVKEELEHADVAILIRPRPSSLDEDSTQLVHAPATTMRAIAKQGSWAGRPNVLTRAGGHRPWSEIDRVHAATRKAETPPAAKGAYVHTLGSTWLPPAARGVESVSTIVRTRRSAVDMDGRTAISAEAFFRIAAALVPALAPVPWDVAAWPAAVHLAVLVHRVTGLAPGLYLLARSADSVPSLRESVNAALRWETPPGCPEELLPYLFHLHSQDMRQAGKQLSCVQNIAGDGCFTLGMLADFSVLIDESGVAPWMYKRLYWEAGAVGHVIYLEAELAGVRGTGIGCFFDDPFHSLLGLQGGAFQSLYHFAVGGPVDDQRLQTVDPYRRATRPPA